jgi:hypothetical protein
MSTEQTSAEMWAAVAAVASAITAFGAFWWQRRATLDGARPELMPEEFSVQQDGATFYFRAAKVRNVGTGVAYSIYVTVPGDGGDSLTLVGGGNHLPVLAPGAAAPLELEVIDMRQLSREMPILETRASIMCLDRLGNMHNVRFTFLRTIMSIGFTQPIAPGVVLADRVVSTTSSWSIRAQRFLRRLRTRAYPVGRRIPVVRRWIPPRDEFFGD